MRKEKETTDAVKILHRRYIGDDPERKASLQRERDNAEVARTIYELRKEAGLSQKDLADMIGTTQSVISRLEDDDYDGHSLKMLNRIARALNQRVTVLMTADDEADNDIRYAFRELVRGLRREKGLTVDDLAAKLGTDRGEVIAMERNNGYRPSPLVLKKLSEFHGIAQTKLAVLAGAVREIPPALREQASRFATKSGSFSKLTSEEKETLDEFVRLLRSETRERGL